MMQILTNIAEVVLGHEILHSTADIFIFFKY